MFSIQWDSAQSGRSNYELSTPQGLKEAFVEALRLDPQPYGVHLELGKVYIAVRGTDTNADPEVGNGTQNIRLVEASYSPPACWYLNRPPRK